MFLVRTGISYLLINQSNFNEFVESECLKWVNIAPNRNIITKCYKRCNSVTKCDKIIIIFPPGALEKVDLAGSLANSNMMSDKKRK